MRGRSGLVRAAAAAVVTAALVQLATYYFALGFFQPLPWAAGLVVAVLLARRWSGSGRRAGLRTAGAALAYVLSAWAFQELWFDRQSLTTARMTWEDRGAANDFGEPEVVLCFVEHPSFHEGWCSEEFASYLAQRGAETIDVTFRIVRDLGCLRSASAVRIGEMEGCGRPRSATRGTAATPAIRAPPGTPGACAPPTSPTHPPPWGPDPWWCR